MLVNHELRILQNNLHKCQSRLHSILNDCDTKQYAILLLQEQYWSLYTESSLRHPSWTLYEPTTRNNEQPRSSIYINNNLLSAAQITHIDLPLSDVTAIELATKDQHLMLIVNVYKPCDKNIIPELHEHLRAKLAARSYTTIIIAGDFNCHHPCWNPRGYTRHDEEADALVEMMTELELNLLIPAGTITYPNAGTAIDLIWGNDEIKNQIIKCRIAEENDHTSDHLPLETIIAIQTEPPRVLPSYNYEKTNWKELNQKLEVYLSELTTDRGKLTTNAEVDNYAVQLVEAIKKAIQETTPRKRPSPHSKRWWTVELTRRRREANKLRNKYKRTKSESDRAAWRVKANQYTREISQAKENKWKEYVSNVDDKSIWKIKDFITNTYTPTFIPTLKKGAATIEQKFSELKKAFFPKPPPADLTDISSSVYPPEVPCETQIAIRQIREAINKLASDKAPGPDEITNRVLKNTLSTIERHLQALMQVSFDLGHFPKAFKHTTTVVLRKPNKSNYTKVKAYQPVALECTLGKVMESIIAEIISYLTETHELLPAHHYGGRPGRSTEDAMMVLSESIYRVWKGKKVYTALFMDVAGAFNNVQYTISGSFTT
jgi:Endonuclease-reverse transcriptase/Reverse transcriptase (RNA-dependent DNA polymerase)